MIQANELRIGNWIILRKDYYQIYCMDYDEILTIKGKLHATKFELEPIPLTEEILLKCGFEYNQKVESFSIVISIIWAEDIASNKVLYIKYDKDYNFFWYGIQDYALDNVAISRIKHLHQLQNLYFALINEELKIEL